MNRFVAGFLIVAFSLTLALGLIESVLYIFPELIPIAYLIKFNKAVARDIASERGFAVQKEGLRIRRDDNGPPLVLPPADHVRIIPAHDLDIEIGAVELHLMDRNGMCNQSVPESASIVTLGDSFTWCTAVKSNATWTAVLQRELAISTYNVSKPREGLYGYLQMFKAIGTRLKPELMVMAFYEGNDLRDALEYSTWLKGPERKAQSHKVSPRSRSFLGAMSSAGRYILDDTWLGKSRAINFLLKGTLDIVQSLRWTEDASSTQVNFRYSIEAAQRRIPFNVENTDIDEVISAKKLLQGEVSLDVLLPALQEFARLARVESFVPVLISIPSAYVAYESSVEFEDISVGQVVLAFSLEQRTYLKTVTSELGVHFIDMASPLQAEARSAGCCLYFPANLHLSPLGHKAVATILKAELLNIVRDRCTSNTPTDMKLCSLLESN